MNPDDRQLSHGGGEPQSSDSLSADNSPGIRPAPPVPRPAQRDPTVVNAQREAAANMIRNNIDNLFDKQSGAVSERIAKAQAQAQATENQNPYLRTHTDAVATEAEQWKAYHTAWQTYYQQYYQAFYDHHLKQTVQQAPKSGEYFANQPELSQQVSEEETMTKDEALLDLRSKLLRRVSDSAKKVRKSRHFVPIIAGVLIILLFVFIQYNKLFIGTVAAYVSPGSVDPQNIVINPSTDVQVGPEPLIVIPKINVKVPVAYDVGNDYDSQMAAMQNGLAHFAIPGADSHPGQVGNTVVAGHSSNDLFDSGDYKFIFAQLEKLAVGDTVYANYNSIRYTYVVTKISVVGPTDVSALVLNTDKPILTLVTCTPLGTSQNRLLVFAEQVSPDPAQAAKPTESTTPSTSTTTISGANSPSLFERLFQ